jgi:hypothetical protein
MFVIFGLEFLLAIIVLAITTCSLSKTNWDTGSSIYSRVSMDKKPPFRG